MRNILILGAGKSSASLIDYLVQHAAAEQWTVTVADVTEQNALLKTKGRANTQAAGADLTNTEARQALIQQADVVISMLPAMLHLDVAKDCLLLKKNLVTPSYISDGMKAMSADVEKAGLLFMNEMGLDPGIDHMSAVQLIERVEGEGFSITGFKSHCGGLVAPESDTNPWHYKFTWNPRNVVLAGQGAGGIHYLNNGEKVDLTYEELFSHTSQLHVEGYGNFESYPNRDSLKYKNEYGLFNAETIYRGTLRVPPFCKGWQCLVNLGLTDESEHRVDAFLAGKVEIRKYLNIGQNSEEEELLNYLELSEKLQALQGETFIPAKFLQGILEEKWKLSPGDKDMVVMVHELEYKGKGTKHSLQSSMVYIGKDEEHTAMAITVGLPVAMVTRMLLNNRINRRGVLMPVYSEIYNPILAELKNYGIEFTEKVS